MVGLLSRPDFDPRTDAVVMAEGGTIQGTPVPTHLEVTDEQATRLLVRVDTPAPAVLVWSRTFFRAWRARVDGQEAETVVADGHLLGVRLSPGAHEVEVRWSLVPLVAGAALSLAAVVALIVLRRS